MALITPLKTAAEQQLAEQFASIKAELPGAGAMRKLREDAFAGFEAKGLPHRRLESWRYTDLRNLVREAMPLARRPARPQAIADRLALQTIAGRRFVTIDGLFSAADSDLQGLPAGITARSLAEALTETPDEIAAAFAVPEVARDDSALMLNSAFAQDGVVIEIAPGTEFDQPLVLLALGSGESEAAIISRSLIKVGAGAKVTIVELHEGVGAAPVQLNHATAFVIGDGAEVEHVRMVTRQRAETVQVQSLLAELGAHVSFDSVAVAVNCGVLRQQSFLRYGGEHTRAALRGINLLRKQEHSDVTLVMDHAAAHGESRELFKTIIEGEGTGVFQGKVIVRQHSQKVDGSMKSHALLLNDGATMFNKPELEIFADDVVCGHGATVAQIDAEQLFYLMARGLPRPQAEALVLAAFVGEVSDLVGDEGVREIVSREIDCWLGQRDGAPKLGAA
ncbi:SufD family Fe-S cluster assembly protein [Bosea sp. LjRoot90]|uniref:SufB/SufD family protein n=1 Tax=Bosea sp. LjRoot90 TaxID=3342342 RepID=UPI003ECE5F9D